MSNIHDNMDNLKSKSQDNSNNIIEKNPKDSSTKIEARKEYKQQFDKLVHEAYEFQVDFIENLIESKSQDKSNNIIEKNPKDSFTTIKVRKEYKQLFDKLAHEAYQSKGEFIESLIEYWREGHKK
ncbi:hypothetical protein [Staphylococcus hominis]|uniref:hypothetical protein n=1 Tax=Staphylococcus hominis TaxID=1290 RepID=UPI00066A76A9|nr:hypothetical protein [Staphylococcus hominis]